MKEQEKFFLEVKSKEKLNLSLQETNTQNTKLLEEIKKRQSDLEKRSKMLEISELDQKEFNQEKQGLDLEKENILLDPLTDVRIRIRDVSDNFTDISGLVRYLLISQ